MSHTVHHDAVPGAVDDLNDVVVQHITLAEGIEKGLGQAGAFFLYNGLDIMPVNGEETTPGANMAASRRM